MLLRAKACSGLRRWDGSAERPVLCEQGSSCELILPSRTCGRCFRGQEALRSKHSCVVVVDSWNRRSRRALLGVCCSERHLLSSKVH
jgi:hypothetical protein